MADPEGVAVAFADATFDTTPTWTRLDDSSAGPWRVNGWSGICLLCLFGAGLALESV